MFLLKKKATPEQGETLPFEEWHRLHGWYTAVGGENVDPRPDGGHLRCCMADYHWGDNPANGDFARRTCREVYELRCG